MITFLLTVLHSLLVVCEAYTHYSYSCDPGFLALVCPGIILTSGFRAEKGEMRHSIADDLVIENVFPVKYIMNLEMGVRKKAVFA